MIGGPKKSPEDIYAYVALDVGMRTCGCGVLLSFSENGTVSVLRGVYSVSTVAGKVHDGDRAARDLKSNL